MREWEIGAVENIHGALPYIRFAPILALVGVGVNRIRKIETMNMWGGNELLAFEIRKSHIGVQVIQQSGRVLPCDAADAVEWYLETGTRIGREIIHQNHENG